MGKPVSGDPGTFLSGAALIQPGKHEVEVLVGSRFVTQTGGKDEKGNPLPHSVSWRILFRVGDSETSWHYRIGERKYIAPSVDGTDIVPDDPKAPEESGPYLTTADLGRDEPFRLGENASISHLIRSAVELGVPREVFSDKQGRLAADCLAGLKAVMTLKSIPRGGSKPQDLPVFLEIATLPGGEKKAASGAKASPAAKSGEGSGPSIPAEHRTLGEVEAIKVLEGKDEGMPIAAFGAALFSRLAGAQGLKPKQRVQIKKFFTDPASLLSLNGDKEKWFVDTEASSVIYIAA